jgi:hypothetical protein
MVLKGVGIRKPKIVPLVSENLPLEERVRRLEGQGLLRPLSKRNRGPMPPPLPAPEGAAQSFLEEDRYGSMEYSG